MKKIILYTGFIITASLVVGCKKYLEKEPDNRAKLTDPKKVSQLLVISVVLYPKVTFDLQFKSFDRIM